MKLALVALAGTCTRVGAVRAALLLDRLTFKPPDGAADVSVTLHVSEPAPVRDALVQVRLLSAALVGALSCSANDCATPPALAESVAV